MTYYEELGVAGAASVEEIRHAYRRVARLIHPDQCTDEETRRLADLQMKRLNGMLAVLADGAQRAKYDASILDVPALPDARTFLSNRLHQQQAAAGLAALLLALTLTLWPHRQVTPQPIITPPVPPETAPRPKKPADPQVYQTHHQTPSPAPPQVVPEPPPVSAPSPSPSPPEPAVVAAIRPRPLDSPPIEPAPSPTLSGRWLFVPSPSIKHSGYPPEYIELHLTESAGVLHGRYQARYRVTDRAISPNVIFRFDGRAGSDGGMLPWDGPGGAKGEVTLRLLDTGNLEVDWVARQLGQELALISGTATLVRKLE